MIGASKATTTREFQLLSTTSITSTGTQTYTVPAGVRYLEIEMYGGGGAGGHRGTIGSGRTAEITPGAGGGGGAYVLYRYYGVTAAGNAPDLRVSDTINFDIGEGGAVTSGNGENAGRGETGGDTTLTIHGRGLGQMYTFTNVYAGGGQGGEGGQTDGETDDYSTGGLGGIAGSNSDIITGNTGNNGGRSHNDVQGGDGGDGADPDGGAGGDGGNAGQIDGDAGTAPGGGGGGAKGVNTGDGGIGADGRVIVKAYG